jgi:hypothetical protein
MTAAYSPEAVIPAALGGVVRSLPYWFVIGGHAVRCFCPYRPSRDVDFGVKATRDLDELLGELARTGRVEISERTSDTAHLTWNDVNVSIFVLGDIAAFIEDRRLNLIAILATKVHAIMDRGLRRDFFDLYVMLQHHRLGVAECLSSLREVYRQPIKDGLVLRALTYFDDAEREAALPGEGPKDWSTVKEFFRSRIGHLLTPPAKALQIQVLKVDVASTS